MTRRLITQPAALIAFMVVPTMVADAQRWRDDVEGAETCRAIWREFGRSMSGRPVAVYCEVREIGTMPRRETLDIDGGDRSGLQVRGERRSDLRVSLVIQAQGNTVDDARALAQTAKINLSESPLRVTGLDPEYMRGKGGRRFVAATIVVDVPEETNLSLSVNYAPLKVENVRGRMNLRASYGPITLDDVGGDVRARVDHGPLTVSLTGPRWQGTGLDAEAEYGPVTLLVPRNFGAQLDIGTRQGPLDIDFPLTLTRLDGSMIQTTMGSGGPRVRAVAQYGPMSLKMNHSSAR
jgi:hypothetical protein